MYVLITCKYQKDRIENNQERVEKLFSPLQVYGGGYFSGVQGHITPESVVRFGQKFELFLDIMHFFISYNFKIDLIISKREKVATSIF